MIICMTKSFYQKHTKQGQIHFITTLTKTMEMYLITAHHYAIKIKAIILHQNHLKIQKWYYNQTV